LFDLSAPWKRRPRGEVKKIKSSADDKKKGNPNFSSPVKKKKPRQNWKLARAG